jgi:hypothetical protein
MKKTICCFLLLATFWQSARSDEGMWMIQDIHEGLEKNMKARGLRLSAGEIYNADAPGASISDAVVSLGFYCTGSVISDEGLIITNHHCAYGNISKLSTPEHNYLENGFWAMNRRQEIPIEGEQVFFLKKILDVTEEVSALADEFRAKGEAFGNRKLGAAMERKYKEDTGLEAIMTSMWTGEKYYMSLYKVYADLRLVAAPPVSIGYFGGDTDNWEWPRHNCDFALYRVYDEQGVPVRCGAKLKISKAGYVPGSFTMVIGYPASTDRYASATQVDYLERVSLPISNELRGERIDIIRKWMDRDPMIRMKYSDWFFNLSNVQENNAGMVACFKRFGVTAEKRAQDRELQRWIDASQKRKALWGNLTEDLRRSYARTEKGEIEKAYFRETLFTGTYISRYVLRAGNASTLEKAKEALMDAIRETDPRVERELLAYALEKYYTCQDNYYFGEMQFALQDRFGTNYKAMADYLWKKSLLLSEERIRALDSIETIKKDPLHKLLTESPITLYNHRNDHLQKRTQALDLEREYKRALYRMNLSNEKLQYPDANSTMRISYGTVGGYEPNDAVLYSWYSTTDGILEKYDSLNHDFNLDARQKFLLQKGNWGKWAPERKGIMPVDFLSDNDITGGNSGSPVLNARGELIGLAFDGNKESLASDASYTQSYNKCINTDIRFVLWVLDKYAGMKWILRELDITDKPV